MHRFLLPIALVSALAAGCATMDEPVDDPTIGLEDADIRQRVLENGDQVFEYRVAGLLRVVKIVPAVGVTYYLVDNTRDGILDARLGRGPITPVQYKIAEW